MISFALLLDSDLGLALS